MLLPAQDVQQELYQQHYPDRYKYIIFFQMYSADAADSSSGYDEKEEHVIAVISSSSSSSNIISTFESSPLSSSSKGGTSTKKLVHSSIRIEEDVFKSLQREADKQGISVNSLINKILKNYLMSDIYFEQLGFLLLSKDFLRKTFSELKDEKRIIEYGRELGLTAAKEFVSYFFPDVNNNTIIQFLDIWFKRFQSYQHRVEDIVSVGAAAASDSGGSSNSTKNKREEGGGGGEEQRRQQQQKKQQQRQRHIFTISHDINYNFSLSLKSMLEGLVEPIVKSAICFRDITPSSISFSFDVVISSSNSK